MTNLRKQFLTALSLSAAFILFEGNARGEDYLGTIPIGASGYAATVPHGRSARHYGHVDASGNAFRDPRPARWCGYWLRHRLGVADRAYNLARNWIHFGSPANSNCINCIAVFPHHVGLVTGRPAPGKIILLSGNDGHAVRERERSSRGVIAWRWPYQSFAGAE